MALLLHVLQVAAWGLVGYLVGRVKETAWAERMPLATRVAAVVVGMGVAWTGVYAVPAWLQLASFDVLLRTPGTHVGLVVSGVLTLSLYQLYHALRQPAVRQRAVRVRRGWPTVATSQGGAGTADAVPSADDDLIMIELD